MNLEQLRDHIDQIDYQIIENINTRFQLVSEVAKFKKENNIEALQKGRWQEVLNSRKTVAKDLWIEEDMIEEIWEIFHKYALKLESKIINW